jgi:phosphoglycerate kinase
MDLNKISKLKDLEVEGRRVLVRVDFDCPLKNGVVADDTKIKAVLPTVNYLLENNARVILMSHLGPQMNKPDSEYSLEPIGKHLAAILEPGEIYFTDSCVGDGAKSVTQGLKEGQVCLLENLYFHRGEPVNDDKMARELASFCDIYINDAFSMTHLKLASTVGIAKHVHFKTAGLLMEKEIKSLSRLIKKIERPYVAVLGGRHLSEQIDIIEPLIEKVDTIILGGALANTFIEAKGGHTAASETEKNKFPLARDIMARAEHKGVSIVLPKDVIAAQSIDSNETQTVSASDVPDGLKAFDIGPESRSEFKKIIAKSGTLFWKGVMGMFENPAFSAGTQSIAKAIAGCAAFSVVGGKNAPAAVRMYAMEKGMDHISTGATASKKMINGILLPGIEALLE